MNNKVLEYCKNAVRRIAYLNKYTLCILAFGIWISLFDRYSFINQFKLSSDINELEATKADYESQLNMALLEREDFNSDMEKYAREKYLFHKDNEQVILIK